MAEIMEEKKELTPAETAAPASPETPAKRAEKSTADKKKRRRTIRRIVALVVVAALIAGGVKFFKKKDGSSEVGTAVVSYGAISSVVDGSGLVKAKNSETITLTTAGTVMDVFVEEGQQVEQGTPCSPSIPPTLPRRSRRPGTRLRAIRSRSIRCKRTLRV